jgi:hypothetical protein
VRALRASANILRQARLRALFGKTVRSGSKAPMAERPGLARSGHPADCRCRLSANRRLIHRSKCYCRPDRSGPEWAAARQKANARDLTALQESSHRRVTRHDFVTIVLVAPQSALLCANAGPRAIDSATRVSSRVEFIQAEFNGTGVRSPYIQHQGIRIGCRKQIARSPDSTLVSRSVTNASRPTRAYHRSI